MSWTALVVLSAGAYAFKLAGVVAGERFADRLAPVTTLLPAALFSALVVTMAMADGPSLVVDARLIGVAAVRMFEGWHTRSGSGRRLLDRGSTTGCGTPGSHVP